MSIPAHAVVRVAMRVSSRLKGPSGSSRAHGTPRCASVTSDQAHISISSQLALLLSLREQCLPLPAAAIRVFTLDRSGSTMISKADQDPRAHAARATEVRARLRGRHGPNGSAPQPSLR